MNILILEDDRILNLALSFSLKNIGQNTISCFTGNEAVNVLENEAIDLIVSDLMTPQQTGLNFLINLRDGIGFNIPIIIISGLSRAENLVKQYNLNCLAFFHKPINLQKMIDLVMKIEQNV